MSHLAIRIAQCSEIGPPSLRFTSLLALNRKTFDGDTLLGPFHAVVYKSFYKLRGKTLALIDLSQDLVNVTVIDCERRIVKGVSMRTL